MKTCLSMLNNEVTPYINELDNDTCIDISATCTINTSVYLHVSHKFWKQLFTTYMQSVWSNVHDVHCTNQIDLFWMFLGE